MRSTLGIAVARLEAGFSVFELVAAIGLVGILAGFSAARLSVSDMALWQSRQQLITDLRGARSQAIITGDHFRVDVVDEKAYRVSRLNLVDDQWAVAAGQTRRIGLPNGVKFAVGAGASFEFNTRGLLVGAGATTELLLADARTQAEQSVTVWPSGQVEP